MAVIAPHVIEQLRAASVPALIADYVDLRKSGPRWTAPCPFHRERTASFTVYDDHYHCFGCGVSGTGIDFLMRIEGMRFPEAARLLADRIGVSVEFRPISAAQARLATEDAEFCRWWWDSRMSMLENAVHENMDDEEFAGTLGRVLQYYRSLTVLDRLEVFRKEATARDRREWQAQRGAVERWWLGEFGKWWLNAAMEAR